MGRSRIGDQAFLPGLNRHGDQVGPNRRQRRRDPTVAGAVTRFALAGLIALAVVGVISFLVTRNIGSSEALKHARDVTRIVGREESSSRTCPGAWSSGARRRSRDSIASFTSGSSAIPIVRVKVWTPSGRLRLLRRAAADRPRYKLGSDELASLKTGEVDSGVSDLSLPGEPLRARARRAARGLPAGQGRAGGTAAVRGLPAVQLGGLERPRDLARVRAGSADRASRARAGPAPARLLDGKENPPWQQGARGAPAACRRRVRCGAAPDRRRSARRDRPGPGRALLLARGRGRAGRVRRGRAGRGGADVGAPTRRARACASCAACWSRSIPPVSSEPASRRRSRICWPRSAGRGIETSLEVPEAAARSHPSARRCCFARRRRRSATRPPTPNRAASMSASDPSPTP